MWTVIYVIYDGEGNISVAENDMPECYGESAAVLNKNSYFVSH